MKDPSQGGYLDLNFFLQHKRKRMNHKVHWQSYVPFWRKNEPEAKTGDGPVVEERSLSPQMILARGMNHKVHSLSYAPFWRKSKPEAKTGDGPVVEERSLSPQMILARRVPLPPGGVQPPQSTRSSRRGMKTKDDPFLAAYMECTKSKKGGGLGKNMNISVFSCKHSCSAREDSVIIRTSKHRPVSHRRERGRDAND